MTCLVSANKQLDILLKQFLIFSTAGDDLRIYKIDDLTKPIFDYKFYASVKELAVHDESRCICVVSGPK